MARELDIRIDVSGTATAKRNLRSVDSELDRIDKTGATANARLQSTVQRMDGTGLAAVGMASHLGRSSVVMGALGVAAAGVAVILVQKLVTAIRDTITEGTRLAALETSFHNLTAAAGETGEAFLGAVKAGSLGLIDNFTAMEAANKALLLGLPVTASEMGTLASTATALGRAMGLEANVALDNLITGLGRSSPLILDNLGITVDAVSANEAYAESIGKTTTELTAQERTLAFYAAGMEAARLKVEEMGAVQLTLGDHLTVAQTTWNDFTRALQVAIVRSPVLTTLLSQLSEAFVAVFGERQQQTIQAVVDLIEQLAIVMARTARFFVDSANLMIGAMATLSTNFADNMARMIGFLDSMGLATDGMKAAAAQSTANAEALVAYNESLDEASAFLLDLEADLKAAKDQADVFVPATHAAEVAMDEAGSAAQDYSADLRQATTDTVTLTTATLGLRSGLAGLSLPGAMTLQGPPGGPGLLNMGIPGIPGIPTSIPDGLPGAMQLPGLEGGGGGGWWQSILGALGGFQMGGTLVGGGPGGFVNLPGAMALPGLAGSTGGGGGGILDSIGGFLGSPAGGGLVMGALSGVLGDVGGGGFGQGAQMGAMVGSIIPGVGTLIGGAVGGLIGAFAGPSEHEKVNDIRDEFVELNGGIEALNVKAVEAGLSLDDMLAADSVEEYEAAIKNLDAGMAEFTRKQQEAAQLLKDQIEAVKTAGGALADRVGITAGQFEGKDRDDLSQGQLGRLGRDVSRQGMLAESLFREQLALTDDYAASLAAVGPALDQIIDLQDRFGLTVSESTQKLLDQRRIMVENEDQIAAINAITTIVTNLGDTGLLTAQQFNQMGNDMKRQFDQLQKNGATSEQAIIAILPALTAINDASQEFGFALDDRTQKLVDQAKEQGLLKDQTTADAESMVTDIAKVETATELVAAAWLKVKGDMEAVDWEGMKNEAVKNLRAVREEVDGIALGSSPGGIKEWVLKLDEFAERLSDIRAKGEADLAAIRSEVENLTDRQRELISSAIDLGLSYDDIAKSVGASTAALEEFNKQQQEAAKLAEQQYADYLRAKEADARGLANLADIQRGIEEDLALQGKTGLEAEMIRLDQERRALYRQVEALRATAGDEAVDAVRDMIHQLFQLREGEAIANDALNNAPPSSSGQGGISLSRTFLTPLESVTGVQTQVGSGGHTFNLTINANSAEGGEAAADAFIEALRRRGVPIRA